MDASQAAKNGLECVLEAKNGERMTILCDDSRIRIGEAFINGALKLKLKTRLTPLKTEPHSFRKDIPPQITDLLTKETPDIYVNLLNGTHEETPFRIKLIRAETEKCKTRLGHCPGITLDMLTEGALAMTTQEHAQMQEFAKVLIKKLDKTLKIRITNPAGTNITMDVQGRPFFTDTIHDKKTMKWMNLPTGEVTVAPVESAVHGKLVCDMAIGGIGPLKTLLEMTIKNGSACDAFSRDSHSLSKVREALTTDEQSSTVGEFSFGINPKARFVEEFLEAEKMLGTIHIAFGDNTDMPGGKNASKNHMDFLVSKPSVEIAREGDSKINILHEGLFQHLPIST
jgi:hypothetical protein